MPCKYKKKLVSKGVRDVNKEIKKDIGIKLRTKGLKLKYK